MRFGTTQGTARWLQAPFLLLLATLLSNHVANSEIVQLTSDELYDMATTGQIDLMIDVRTAAEWNSGHIENATFIEDLQVALRQSNDYETTLRDLNLWGCRFCRVAVYCRSGARAGAALDLLERAGFEGELYNGLGVSQWTEAGYELFNTASVDDRPCMTVGESSAISRQASACAKSDGPTVEEFPFEEPVGTYEVWQNELSTSRDLFLAQMVTHNATSYSFQFTLTCFCLPADYPWTVTAELQHMTMAVKPPPSNGTNDLAEEMLVDPVRAPMGDVVTSAITSAGEDIVATESESFVRVYSILDLFDKIQQAIDTEADEIRVVYNSEWGYPEDIFIDYNRMMADEEFYVTASDLEVGQHTMRSLEEEDAEDGLIEMIGVDEESP